MNSEYEAVVNELTLARAKIEEMTKLQKSQARAALEK